MPIDAPGSSAGDPSAGTPGRAAAPVRRLEATVGGPARLRVVAVLAAVLALSAADSATVGAVAQPLERALHIGNTSLGLLVTASTAVGAVATLPMGALADRMRRTRLLAAAVLAWSVMLVACGASVSYGMLLATRVGLGLVVAVAGPVVSSLTGDWFPPAERGRIFGYVLSGELIGAGIGFVVCGDVAAATSWRWAFWVLAVPGVVLARALHRLPEPARGGGSRLPAGATEPRPSRRAGDGAACGAGTGSTGDADTGPTALQRAVLRAGVEPAAGRVLCEDPTGRSTWWAVRYVLSIPTNRVLIASSALGYFFFAGLRTFAVLFLRDRFGLGQATASTLLVVVGAGALAGVLVTGRVADGLVDRGRVAARPLVAGVALLIAAVVSVPALLVPSLLVAAPLFALATAGLGGTNPPLDAARLDLVHPRLWGRAEAVRTVLRSVFEATAPLLFGWVSTRLGTRASGLGDSNGAVGGHSVGLDHTFLVMLVPLGVAGLLLVVVAARTYPRDVATASAAGRASGPPTGTT